ncbi:biopolymer transporter ExbB [Pseudooceanicola sediminis]|uniref:Biopolymer transporter ExbB n=1 Tax=Pseudooceanicola sediminis TaxID=2211117 RepID=A0A399IWP7_9RHOB|nr:biopolymer transporter ExbB [Pseudooceanicola sediminis]KAA2312391.1 biopolymer transporter ExbB [Puniceibacterium sp. HSS470]RII37441.1 biopolymer transporter ExbB [Pseudooceanicola sediminis]|tara:strand:- start:4060 stop:5265 length:1206 start_codon:yes stop_codon:yes gene_type:complete
MDHTDREVAQQFSQPIRQIILMLIVIGMSGAGAVFAAPSVLPVFIPNPYLNGFIAFVFVLGVLACFWQVVQLISSVRWIERFTSGNLESIEHAPRLLTPLATLLGARNKRMQISSTAATSILESVVTRIDEAREITRYITSLLIFLGLLGTFYGLATTVPALVETIRSLAPQDGEDGIAVFTRLMAGLQGQLDGMGVAFASSLLGLTGSLIVGLLELFAGHGQNRFYRELEEWLSTITRLGLAEGDGAADQSILVGVLDNIGEQMEGMQQMFARSDQARAEVDYKLSALADTIERLTDRMAAQNAVTSPIAEALSRIADGQDALLAKLAETSEGIDAESRMRLRSMDVQLLRILEEISAGRHETMAELRTDIAALSRVISQTQRGQISRVAPPRSDIDQDG